MGAIDYESEYNNRARVPEHPAIIENWTRDGAAFRQAAVMETDVAYGPRPRNRMDLFYPDESRHVERLVVFVHGGYWQALDKSFFSHLAAGPLAHGVAVAMPGYSLCPDVRVGDIVAETQAAVRALWERFGLPVAVSGHSAGGHLAAALLATDWGAERPLVRAAQPISGLFELAPLIPTSLNTALRLDAAEAAAQSPLDWPAPAGLELHAWVGANESGEFLRQSRTIVETWRNAGVGTRYHAVNDANHFTVVAPLTDPDSDMTRDLVALASLR